jgi:predicted nucleic acid-binding protein
VTPALMLAEVAGAISRRTGMPKLGQQAVDSLLRLRARRLVAVDRRLGREAARLAAVAGLCGADAVYTALARHLSIPLVTWDDELQQRAGPVLVVQRPASPSPLA